MRSRSSTAAIWKQHWARRGRATSNTRLPTSASPRRRSGIRPGSHLRKASAGLLTITAPPKLVRVITRMNIGGPSRHVTILTTQGGPEFDTMLLAGDPEAREGSLEAEAAGQGAHVIHVPHLRRPVSPIDDLLALVWLFRYFRRERPAIVATHLAKAGTVGRLAAALAGVPVRVHTFHGHVLDGYFGRVSTTIFTLVERFLGRLTTQFVAISPEIAHDLDRLDIGRGKTVIVRLGLKLDHLAGH